jgi:hypothetical protein
MNLFENVARYLQQISLLKINIYMKEIKPQNETVSLFLISIALRLYSFTKLFRIFNYKLKGRGLDFLWYNWDFSLT